MDKRMQGWLHHTRSFFLFLLLSTLHPLGTTMSILILIVGLLLSLSLLPPHLLFDIHIMHGCLLALIKLHVSELRCSPWRENALKSLALLWGEGIREVDCEVDVQLAPHEWPLVDRHSFIVNGLELIWNHK